MITPILVLLFLFFLINNITIISAACPSGMVSYWNFDETSGTVASDSVGTNNGTLVNGPVWTTGKVGGALQFNGVDDHVSIPDSQVLRDLTSTFSVSFWVNKQLRVIIVGG